MRKAEVECWKLDNTLEPNSVLDMQVVDRRHAPGEDVDIRLGTWLERVTWGSTVCCGLSVAMWSWRADVLEGWRSINTVVGRMWKSRGLENGSGFRGAGKYYTFHLENAAIGLLPHCPPPHPNLLGPARGGGGIKCIVAEYQIGAPGEGCDGETGKFNNTNSKGRGSTGQGRCRMFDTAGLGHPYHRKNVPHHHHPIRCFFPFGGTVPFPRWRPIGGA
jgi:hypothetical protein